MKMRTVSDFGQAERVPMFDTSLKGQWGPRVEFPIEFWRQPQTGETLPFVSFDVRDGRLEETKRVFPGRVAETGAAVFVTVKYPRRGLLPVIALEGRWGSLLKPPPPAQRPPVAPPLPEWHELMDDDDESKRQPSGLAVALAAVSILAFIQFVIWLWVRVGR